MVPVSRRGFYRSLQEQQPVEEEMEVRSAIQQVALEHRRRYGYRRITAELHRPRNADNHKRVVRIMGKDDLLGLQSKRFKVTTDSNHKFEVYLNLAARMKLRGINQLVGSGHHLHSAEGGICLLGVILDGFSRKVVGWALDRTLAMRLTFLFWSRLSGTALWRKRADRTARSLRRIRKRVLRCSVTTRPAIAAFPDPVNVPFDWSANVKGRRCS